MQQDRQPERDAGGVEILSKAAAVVYALESLGESTASALAERVGEPVSSTYRLLTRLLALGWVDRGSRWGLYRLGVLFLRVGGDVEDRVDVRRAALPALRELRAQTGGTGFLVVRRGDRATCIERVDGGAVRSLAMRLGDAFPLHAGAAPRAILASLPHSEQVEYLTRLTDTDGEVAARLARDEIERSHARGYTVSDGDVTVGIGAVGAPVRNHRGELVAAVSVSGLRDAIVGDLARVAPLVQDAAARTSAALGWEAQR